MNREQIVRLDTFRRVHEFGRDHESRFPPGSAAARAFAVLFDILKVTNRHAAIATHGARGAFVERRSARQQLDFQLKAIVRIARVIDETLPGFVDRFALPLPKAQAKLLSTAESFLAASEPVADQLIDAGLPDDFLDALRRAADDYARTTDAHAAGRVAAANASSHIVTSIRAGMTAVRRIDAIVRHQFHEDEELQATWRRVKRLSGLPGRKHEAERTEVSSAVPVETPVETPQLESGDMMPVWSIIASLLSSSVADLPPASTQSLALPPYAPSSKDSRSSACATASSGSCRATSIMSSA